MRSDSKILKFIRKNWHFIVLGIIIVLASFVRLYHFHAWMHFEMDQARDAELVTKAMKSGIGELPLLGPRAAGTFLRLGPLFYYLQYFSAKIFHSTSPTVMAYPDLLSSILAVPLFYIFLRLYFKRLTSLLGTAMFASSFIAIQFSRFAWNPNSIPFWTLLAFYGLMRMVNEENSKKRYWWIAMAIVGWGVVSQLHFVTFLAVPAVFFFFLLWTRGFGKIGWKGFALGIILILFFLAPMILSDIKTSGDNAKQFVWAFRNKPDDSSFLSNLKINAYSQARYYTTILTSYSSKTGIGSLLAGMLLILAGGAKIIFEMFKEKDEKRRNFLKLILIWGIFSFLILIPFAAKIKSRYMLFAIFSPFILFLFFAQWLTEGKKYGYFAKTTVIIAAMSVILLNTEATFAWYRGLSQGEDPVAWNNRKLDIKQADGVTLGQMEVVASHIYKKWSADAKKIYLYAKMQYRAPIAFLLESRDPKINVSFISYRDDDRGASYYAVTASKKGYESMPPHYRAKFDVTENGSYQRFEYFDLVLKDIQPTKEQKKELQDSKYRDLPSQTERNTEKGLKRQERVLWENIF